MTRRTLAAAAGWQGTGLHTGAAVTGRLEPAPAGTGITFLRTDLAGARPFRAHVSNVVAVERRTALGPDGSREASIDTVEHLMAALHAAGMDDVAVSVDGPELPIFDGSFTPWVELIAGSGTVEQAGEPAVVRIREPFELTVGSARYRVEPADRLTVSASIEWDHPVIGHQESSKVLTADIFEREVAPARTFGFIHEVAALRERGLLQGATEAMAVVLSDSGVETGELRWPDEFVRHKIGDLVGDLALLGARLEAHVMAERPSHQGNVEVAEAIARKGIRNDPAGFDIDRIMEILPHRYPLLLVDRIIEVEPERRIVGIKNVTINEPFFQGHFPGYPIMPGVLIVEAMAQTGGLLLMDRFEDPGSKVVLFMAIDGVKFRRPVRPGDQLRFELEMLQLRGRNCRMRGEAFVDGEKVCEAEMMARVVDK